MPVDDLKNGVARRIVLVNPPVVAVDRVQLDYYADAQPYGLFQLADWLESLGHETALVDLMAYGKHSRGWDDLLSTGELTPIAPLESGVAGLKLDAWRYGYGLKRLAAFFDAYPGEPDEVWVSCSMLFNAYLAHEASSYIKRRYPKTRLRMGGGYASLSPEHAQQNGADEVSTGRLLDADRRQPGTQHLQRDQHFTLFRLTCGCPNHCAFCINGRQPLHRFSIDDVLNYIERAHRETGIRHFNNWDPNVLRFKPHLKRFLQRMAERDLDVSLRFDMGFEPDLIDDELITLLKQGGVEAFTIPLESTDPLFAEFFEKPYTIVSSIRALEKLKTAGVDLSASHGSSIIGYPEEKLRDLFTLYHVARHYRLISTPFPIVVLPHSPVFERYRRIMEPRPFRRYNGHLFPLIDDKQRLGLYRRLILLLTASSLDVSDRLIERFPDAVQADYAAGKTRAEGLIEQALSRPQADSLDLLDAIYRDLDGGR